MDEKAVGGRRLGGIPVRERLEGTRSLVSCLADRRQQQRLLDPLRRRADHIRARDEHCVVRRRARREVGRAWEEVRRPVLHRADDPPVVVVVDGSPLAPVLLGLLDPPLLRRGPVATRLPPDAVATHERRVAERPLVSAPRRGWARLRPPAAGRRPRRSRRRPRPVARLPSARDNRSRDPGRPPTWGPSAPQPTSTCTSSDGVSCSPLTLHRPSAPDEPGHTVHLARSVGRVAGDDLRRDQGMPLHPADSRPSQHELRDLRPGEEPERHERRAETGRHVEDAGRRPIDPRRPRGRADERASRDRRGTAC